MPAYRSNFLKKAPFIRLLLPLIAGIILQWQLQLGQSVLWIILATGIIIISSLFFFPILKRYRLQSLSGVAVMTIFVSVGALLIWFKDIRHKGNWFGKSYSNESSLVVTLDEPPEEKERSFKAIATVSYLIITGEIIPTQGKIIIYFRKESSVQRLDYGSRIIFKNQIQEIKNSGNPAGFGYKRYSLFKGITHQVYLKPGEFAIAGKKDQKWLPEFVYSTRRHVLNILRKNIRNDKELGLAEALLLGYKNDLDRSLVQSYTNTGVVHIIAVSGLHLGLIYWLLRNIFSPFQRRKKILPGTKGWIPPILIIAGLWLFSLLAGAQPSVLRSAVMFTCIVLGECIKGKPSVYNTLALSAFLLLCYDPYWLWDVGFQLSYSAVLSIIIFNRPIYNLFYIKNKILDLVWKLNAVTLAAQILTIPFCIYYFHQFPSYFLLTNFVAVPLSSIILLGEILLGGIAFVPSLAELLGKFLSWLISLMNTYIERIEELPYSVWDGLQTNVIQTIILYCCITAFSFWFLERSKKCLKLGLIALLVFFGLRSYSFIQSEQQKMIIVYHTPQQQAIDFINGRKFDFTGDTALIKEGFARNFHLRPARVFYRISEEHPLPGFERQNNFIQFMNKKIFIIDSSISFLKTENKPNIDLVIISKNPKLYIDRLSQTLNIKQIVFDGSVPAWKVKYWKKDCDSFNIPHHDVNKKGAFVMNLR
jgi:competence protein ComEC